MNPNGLVLAASITSHTSMPSLSHISAISLTSPIFTARKVFSSSLTISAAVGDDTGTTVSTAVLYSALLMTGIRPSPFLFAKHPDVVWGLIAALYVSNVVLLVLNLPLVGVFARMLALPIWILMPGVVMVAYVGIYSIHHSTFDLLLITAFGLLGYVLRKLDIPLVPVVLGLLLGAIMETNLRRALSISNGDWSILISSPITWVLWVLVIAMLALSIFFERRTTSDAGLRLLTSPRAIRGSRRSWCRLPELPIARRTSSARKRQRSRSLQRRRQNCWKL